MPSLGSSWALCPSTLVCTGWRPCNRLAASAIGEESADTGARTEIESGKWGVRNWRSAAVREGKIPNGIEILVRPTLAQVVFSRKNNNLPQGSGTEVIK